MCASNSVRHTDKYKLFFSRYPLQLLFELAVWMFKFDKRIQVTLKIDHLWANMYEELSIGFRPFFLFLIECVLSKRNRAISIQNFFHFECFEVTKEKTMFANCANTSVCFSLFYLISTSYHRQYCNITSWLHLFDWTWEWKLFFFHTNS